MFIPPIKLVMTGVWSSRTAPVGHLRAGHGASAPSAPRSASGALSGIAGITAVATVGLAVSSRSAKAGARSPWKPAIFSGKDLKNLGKIWEK